MSKLKFVNVFIFQWLFIRLQKTVHDEEDLNPGAIGWGIIGFILPTTGWTNEYRYILKSFYIHLLTNQNK